MKPPETPQSQIYDRQQSSTSASPVPAFVPPETPAKSQVNIIPETSRRVQTHDRSVRELAVKGTSSTESSRTVQKEVVLEVHQSHSLTPAAESPASVVAGIKRKSEAVNCSPYLQDSPFHVSTPESPYGQVFLTPTSDTKKRWKKWIDSFPDFHVDNPLPAPKPRRKSTVFLVSNFLIYLIIYCFLILVNS